MQPESPRFFQRIRNLRPRTKGQWVGASALGVVALLLFLISGLFQWSPLNCWHEEIDIHSGRVRTSRYLLYVCIDRSTRDTWVSRHAEPLGPPEWHRVNTFSPGVRHSPHYLYHGAISQNKRLTMLIDMVPFTPAAEKAASQAMLRAWQNGSDQAAEEFLEQLSRIVLEAEEKNATTISSEMIPSGE